MKKSLITASYFLFFFSILSGQEVITSNSGSIAFFSSAPLEDIKATNTKVNAALNTNTGEILAKLTIKDFNFRKAKMQKHFNEKYMESDEYPHAQFEGKLIDFDINEIKETDAFPVEGTLTIKGVTQPLSTSVVIRQKAEIFQCKADFMVALEDYNIEIPSILTKNIAEEVEVTVNLSFDKP